MTACHSANWSPKTKTASPRFARSIRHRINAAMPREVTNSATNYRNGNAASRHVALLMTACHTANSSRPPTAQSSTPNSPQRNRSQRGRFGTWPQAPTCRKRPSLLAPALAPSPPRRTAPSRTASRTRSARKLALAPARAEAAERPASGARRSSLDGDRTTQTKPATVAAPPGSAAGLRPCVPWLALAMHARRAAPLFFGIKAAR
jgi:hypothetical protein